MRENEFKLNSNHVVLPAVFVVTVAAVASIPGITISESNHNMMVAVAQPRASHTNPFKLAAAALKDGLVHAAHLAWDGNECSD